MRHLLYHHPLCNWLNLVWLLSLIQSFASSTNMIFADANSSSSDARVSGMLLRNETTDRIQESPQVNYCICPESELLSYSEDELQPIYNEAVTKFNIKPKSAREFLASKKVIQGLPEDMANFIIQNPKLSKRYWSKLILVYLLQLIKHRRIGEYIGNVDTFNQCVCDCLFSKYDFANKTLDNALRILMLQFRLPVRFD